MQLELDVHAEDGCTASDVQHHFVLEDVLVVIYRVAVGSRADFIFLRAASALWTVSCGQCRHGKRTNISSWMPIPGQYS